MVRESWSSVCLLSKSHLKHNSSSVFYILVLGSVITCAMLAIFMKCLLYIFRFEIEIEPIFGTLALYDVKEKKKVFFSSSLIR